jgi:hypothetical protein
VKVQGGAQHLRPGIHSSAAVAEGHRRRKSFFSNPNARYSALSDQRRDSRTCVPTPPTTPHTLAELVPQVPAKAPLTAQTRIFTALNASPPGA